MSDYWVREAERRDNENAKYFEWVEKNEDYIIECYVNSNSIEFPDSIYEGVLDDGYPDAETSYLENITIDDVPDIFIYDLYNNTL